MKRQFTATLAALLLAAAGASATAGDLVRHKTPGSDFPILMAVEVPAGYKTVYLSGVVPSVTDAAKPPGSVEAFGDTRTQTVSVMQNIERNLKRLKLSMSDVIKMQVFLVGDPALAGKMDFKGLMAGYTQFFGTREQPNLPTRSVMQVSALANPGWLVEIEVVAAVKDPAAKDQ
jgi:enamine deaminase RidA (YjgF/YER057c/UK114 family)